ncbi:hypothetical protein AAES_57382 [Amazona aestiva]|uniref:Uncharacterized protein n=1 Tax=Amazona aestiva TaxID=12930 RepID=A0A0Q3RDR9_AMAAE|nr:hypothetical protein AAES_57382 [Amazona aestiva]
MFYNLVFDFPFHAEYFECIDLLGPAPYFHSDLKVYPSLYQNTGFWFLKSDRLNVDLMENHGQLLFMLAIDKGVITKYVTDHVYSCVLPHTLKPLLFDLSQGVATRIVTVVEKVDNADQISSGFASSGFLVFRDSDTPCG